MGRGGAKPKSTRVRERSSGSDRRGSSGAWGREAAQQHLRVVSEQQEKGRPWLFDPLPTEDENRAKYPVPPTPNAPRD